jgi:hypothetical protein
MRTVICHFYNEAYMLPWWLNHHTKLFDYGILIDHGSTDDSVDIIRELAPNWRIVRSRLTCFDAYLTDFEVMSYEHEIPGWKIALNVTEFLMPASPLETIELQLKEWGRMGCASYGIICIDHDPDLLPNSNQSLPKQKHWGIDDNLVLPPAERVSIGLSAVPGRNRFYHCDTVGMYHPGRHVSFHQDSKTLLRDLMVFSFSFAPWNEQAMQRKLQIKSRLSAKDLRRGWGTHHLKETIDFESEYQHIRKSAIDLNTHAYAHQALLNC